MPKGKRGFQKGNKIGSAGRPKGAEGAAKREIKEYAQFFLTRPDYILNIEERIFAGEASNIELALYHYAYGKPVERVAPVNPDGETPYGSGFLTEEERIARAIYFFQRVGERSAEIARESDPAPVVAPSRPTE